MEEGKASSERGVYEIRNSVWKNSVLFIICFAFASATPMILSGRSGVDWLGVAGGLLFGAGTIVFGFRAFDRRIKVYADNRVIHDLRNRFGAIAWRDIRSVKVWAVKGNTYLTLYFRDPAKWMQLSSRWTQWLIRATKIKFSTTVSLQNTDVNEASFRQFVDERMAEQLATS